VIVRAGSQRLSILDASNNEIADLPMTFNKLTWLRVIHLSNNKIVDIRPLFGCIGCEELDLSHNDVVDVPGDIGTMPSLVKLDLSHNDITILPEKLGKVTCRLDRSVTMQRLNVAWGAHTPRPDDKNL
jgi:Leucine-rich repeat (LRR) protein